MTDRVTFLLENVTQLLTQEANLLRGVEDQFRLLQNELRLINDFLQNTEGKRGANDELVKEVVSQIRDAAYEAEDVIDTFIVKAIMHRKRSQFGKLIRHSDQENALHDVAKKIESIKIVIREINDNRSKFGIDICEYAGGDAESEMILHRRRKYVEEVDVVGFSKDIEALVKLLVEGTSQRDVVSIIGMGGLGKTTLARKVYNNNVVCNYFDVRAWVYVSQEFRFRELFLEILKSVMPTPQLMILKDELHQELFQILEAKYSLNKDKFKDSTLFTHLEDMKEKCDGEFKEMLFKELNRMEDSGLRDSLESLVEKIYKKNCNLQDFTDDELKKGLFRFLTGRRYLLVLDDIWKTDLWEISAAFPDKLNGSRILITSRIKEVALHASAYSPPYELQFLDEGKSWELFSKKVFRGSACPPELETRGRMLVKHCHGLPLAIVVLGGLLANKEKTLRTWSKYIGYVNSYLMEDRSSCRDILVLSYDGLPRHLKPCFLYFGIYPEDFEIPVRQLIQLWIAEGFIRQIHNRNVEDVAEGYLEELIDHGLIQVATRRADGGVKTCRIHALLLDMCIRMSAEQKFLEVSSNANLSLIGKSRRLSIQRANASNLDISLNPHVPAYTRSLLCLGDETLNAESNLKWDCKTLKFVRVVDLGNIATLIPKKIERLILLRYLRIQPGELEVMPASICSLWNLEILDMRNSKIKRLPKEVWRLQKLKHLYLGGPTSLPRSNNKSLPNLLVLTGIATNQDTESLLAKGRFPSVEKLGLHSLSGVGSTLLSSLHPLAQLQTLKINGPFDLPSPVSFHLNLTKITLLCMNISPTVVKVLGSLTNLRILKIRGVDPVQMNLNCDGSSFPLLETFKMANLEIIYWNMQRGAMPSLQHLVIKSCKYLYMLPDELWCLTSLREVEVIYPSGTLARKLRQLQVKSGCKLQVYPPLSESN